MNLAIVKIRVIQHHSIIRTILGSLVGPIGEMQDSMGVTAAKRGFSGKVVFESWRQRKT